MTDETKELFDAPWKAVEDKDNPFPFMHHKEIVTNNGQGHTIANDIIGDDANRLARLPELYDALANAVRDACQDCVDQVYDHPTDYDPVKHGCLFKDKNCCEMCRSWIELLRKVRDGE